jgi:hypothetical protein
VHNQPDTLHTNTLDSYEWPLCTAGPDNGPHAHRLWAEELDRQVCRPCEDQTRDRLIKLRVLFTQLNRTDMLMKGSSRGTSPTSGTRTAPIPLRLDVLNLTGPGGIATRLQNIEDAWLKAFGRPIKPTTDGVRVFGWSRTHPALRAVPGHVEFLLINLRSACENYESVGQDIDTIRVLHAECTALTSNEPRPGRVPIGVCPVHLATGLCGSPLTASTGSHRVHCTGCGSRWDGMGEWRNLRTAQEAMALETAGAAA